MYTEIASNKRKTILLMLGFVVFITALSWVFRQSLGGMVWGIIIFAVVYALISYFASAQVALALAGAKPIEKRQAPELYRIVENLAITAGLPMPKVYIIEDLAPNAFATGRDPKHAVVAVTTGLIETLDDEELEGVIAHELSHIGNYDIRLMAVVIMLVSIVAILSDFFLRFSFFGGGDDDDSGRSNAVFLLIGIVMSLLAPVVAMLMQLAVSRRREYLADASGAMLTRYPEGLASALKKIAASPNRLRHANNATAHLYIASPFKSKGVGGTLVRLFSTHPQIEDRIAKLNQMKTSV